MRTISKVKSNEEFSYYLGLQDRAWDRMSVDMMDNAVLLFHLDNCACSPVREAVKLKYQCSVILHNNSSFS